MPATPYDVATVEYRVVNVEGCVVYRQNSYSVPWRYIGQALPVRVTETELIIYSPQLEEVARHDLAPRGQTGQRRVQSAHRPSADPRQHEGMLRERFGELGPAAARFLDGLLSSQRYGREQAVKVLALQSSYARTDCWPPWSGPSASAPTPWVRSNASWRRRPSPGVFWKRWPTRNAGVCRRT